MMKKQLISIEPIKEEVRTKLLEKYDSTQFMSTDTIELKLSLKEILEKYIEDIHATEPSVFITTDAYTKMRMLVNKTSTEIGWYGIVKPAAGFINSYIIEDIIVYPQKVTGVTCEQDDDKMFEFEMSLTDDQVNNKRFHGHSHVNMGVTPSGTDENFYQDLLTQVEDYFIIMITNKSGVNTIRFYDVVNNIRYDDVPLSIITEDGMVLDNWYEQNIAENIIKPEPKQYTWSKSLYDDEEEYDTFWRKDKKTGLDYKEIKKKGKKTYGLK